MLAPEDTSQFCFIFKQKAAVIRRRCTAGASLFLPVLIPSVNDARAC